MSPSDIFIELTDIPTAVMNVLPAFEMLLQQNHL